MGFVFPADSPNIVESKSFKYYLNSFNQTVFASAQDAVAQMEKDLSATAGGAVTVWLYSLDEFRLKREQSNALQDALLVDDLLCESQVYEPSKDLLQINGADEQQDQTDQANGLWLSGHGVLLPEDKISIPRRSAMNLFFACDTVVHAIAR